MNVSCNYQVNQLVCEENPWREGSTISLVLIPEKQKEKQSGEQRLLIEVNGPHKADAVEPATSLLEL